MGRYLVYSPETEIVPPELPDWTKPVDKRILEFMERTKHAKLGGMWLKSATIAENFDMNSDYINSRLRKLQREGLVESRPSGYYRITEKGSAFING